VGEEGEGTDIRGSGWQVQGVAEDGASHVEMCVTVV